jgi:hypothetical protein
MLISMFSELRGVQQAGKGWNPGFQKEGSTYNIPPQLPT